ncbi:Transketolase, N-terminal section [Desulfovibrio sp. TomC]|nr:Transketolase, N-terminal section [Desulfovibrio sp. TomC]
MRRLDTRSLMLRKIILQTLGCAKRGHPASAFSLVEILRVLYDHVLQFNPAWPTWPNRDRFILSKGHGCLALYAILADKGYIPQEELTRFCQPGGILGGHPEACKIPGVEASTGSLGHGPSIGVGFALCARLDGTGARSFVLIGDGESNEGSVWEAALCAAKHRLDNFTIIIDYNKLQSYGPTQQVLPLEPYAAKWEAFGFAVQEVDGHDIQALQEAFLALPLTPGKPSVVICHTVKGCGLPCMEHNLKWHHKSNVTEEEVQRLVCELENAHA